MFTRLCGLILTMTMLSGCAPPPDPMQTVRDHLFYDGLAAFHEGYHKEAALRWERAAHFGDGEAARNLGHLYRQGLGVEQDLAMAVKWYQTAIDAGVVSAQYNLGMLYLKGGPKFAADRQQALLWLGKAADAGVGPAQQELDRLASGAEPEQMVELSASFASAPSPAAAPEPAVPVMVPARVQIGSYQTRKAAELDMQRLKRRSDLEFQVVPAGRKDGQQWYRLMAVGKPEEVEAYCREAATHRIGCWPHKSKGL